MGSVARIVTWLLLGTGLALVTTGCLATRDYVDERDNEIKSQLAALTTRVGAAEGRITQAQGKADQVGGALDRSLANRFKREKVSEAGVLFAPGKSELPKDAQGTLDGIVQTMSQNPTYTLDIVGYTDTSGADRYNLNLSWQREETVRRKLTDSGVDMNRVYFIGFGEEQSKGKTAAEMKQDRHVAIRVYKPAN